MSILSKCLGGTISIHALRGEGDNQKNNAQLMQQIISIHALRGEGDKKAFASSA